MATTLLKVSIPDLDIHKTIKTSASDTIWLVKLNIINKVQRVLPQGAHNYGLYLPPSGSQGGGFLEEQRKVSEYRFQQNTALQLQLKTRDNAGKSEKEVAKYNSKKQQQAFMQLIAKKSFVKVRELLDKGLDPNFVSDSGETPLTYAAMNDLSEIIMTLVQSGGAFTDFRSADWKTPLHKAVIGGHVRALKSLTSLGACPDLQDKEGMTPLYLAAVMGKPGCAEALLNAGSVLDTVDDNGRTELHQACLKDSPTVAKLLIEFGATIDVKNLPGNTPLHVAASSNSVECAKLLLAAGADKEQQNGAGDTPHQVAIMTTNWDIAETLGGPKPTIKVEPRSRTPHVLEALSFPNAARIIKPVEYIPPPPPVGYKGICKAPAEAHR